jgi:hypothetical protein
MKYETQSNIYPDGEMLIKIRKTPNGEDYNVQHIIPNFAAESMIDAIMKDVAEEIKQVLITKKVK